MVQDTLDGAGPRALVLLADLAAHRRSQVCRDFDSTLAARLDADAVESAWVDVTDRFGGYEGMGEPHVGPIDGYTVVDVPLTFKAGNLLGRVSYTAGGGVAGLFILDPSAANPNSSSAS